MTIRTLHDYQADIACLSTIRLGVASSRKAKVHIQIAIIASISIAKKRTADQQGVGVSLGHRDNYVLISWPSTSSRVAMARFKSQPVNLNLVSIYVTTVHSDNNIKDELYDILQTILNHVTGLKIGMVPTRQHLNRTIQKIYRRGGNNKHLNNKLFLVFSSCAFYNVFDLSSVFLLRGMNS